MRPTEAAKAVLEEEMGRQRRTAGEVCKTAGINKNALYRVRAGGSLMLDTLWALAAALKLPMTEFAFRVEKRLQG